MSSFWSGVEGADDVQSSADVLSPPCGCQHGLAHKDGAAIILRGSSALLDGVSCTHEPLQQWKGVASYYDFLAPSGTKVPNRVWSYDAPTNTGTDFMPIKGYLSFYASANLRTGEEGWRCMVEGEEVVAQEGGVSSVPLAPAVSR